MFKNNKNWIFLTLGSLLLVLVAGLIKKRAEVSISVYLGIGFLFLTLVPNNLSLILKNNFKPFLSTLARYKRDFGITAGLLFLTHALLAWNIFGKLKPEFLIKGEIILGFLALLIFISLLLTSSKWSIRILKKNWKRLHILVWAAVPLAFLHSSIAGIYFSGELSPIAVLGFSSLYLLAFIQLFIKKWNHFALVLTAWILSMIFLYAFYPQTLADFNSGVADLNKKPETSQTSTSSSISSVNSSSSSLALSSTLSTQGSSTSSSSSSQNNSTTISLSKLNSNNTSSSCWISFAKKVYNVTNYLNEHPGGRRELLKVCGQEIDKYSNSHPGGSYDSAEIQGILKEFYVGDLS